MLGVPRQYLSVALMLSYKLDFSCCADMDGFPGPVTNTTNTFSANIQQLRYTGTQRENFCTNFFKLLLSCLQLEPAEKQWQTEETENFLSPVNKMVNLNVKFLVNESALQHHHYFRHI